MGGNIFEKPEPEFCPQCGAGLGKFRREGEGTCPACDPKPAPKRGTQEWARAKLAEIYNRIQHAGSHFASIHFREKLRNEVREMVYDQVGVLTIEKYVESKIREHELGSIR